MRTRESKINLIAVLKDFWNEDEKEVSIDDAIVTAEGMTEEEKQILQGKTPRIKQLERDLQTHEIEKRPKKSRENRKGEMDKVSTQKNINYIEEKEETFEREER